MMLSIITTFFTGSKKGLMIIFFSLTYFFFTKNQKNVSNNTKIEKKLIIVFTLLILVYMTFKNELLYQMLGKRFLYMFEQIGVISSQGTTLNSGNSTELRSSMYSVGMHLFFEHPVLGWGWNAFMYESGFDMYSHNNYTEILVSMGLIGFLTFYWIYAKLMFNFMLKKHNTNNKFCLFILSCLLFIDASSINMYGSIIDFYIVGIVSLLKNKNKQFPDSKEVFI